MTFVNKTAEEICVHKYNYIKNECLNPLIEKEVHDAGLSYY